MERTYPWSNIQTHYNNKVKQNHLKTLLEDKQRNSDFVAKFEELIFDYTHEKIDVETVNTLFPELM